MSIVEVEKGYLKKDSRSAAITGVAHSNMAFAPVGNTDNVCMPERCSGTSDAKGTTKKQALPGAPDKACFLREMRRLYKRLSF